MTPPLEPASLPVLAPTVLALLLDLTLKGVLVLAFAGLLTVLFKRASAAARHLVWSLALCSVLLLPVLTVSLPTWRVAALSKIPFYAQAIATLSEWTRPVEPTALPVSVDVAEVAASPTTSEALQEGATPTVPSASTALPSPSSPLSALDVLSGSFSRLFEVARAAHWTVCLLVLWLGGVSVVLLRFFLGTAGVWWLAFNARPLTDPAWIDLMNEVRDRVSLRRSVRLMRSTRTAMPMTWGIVRPVVLLPAGAGDWPVGRKRCVLIHEFAHVKRWDCLTQVLTQLACAVYWFNPFIWIAARQMREEREMACDDYVLANGTRPSVYAAHLLGIARSTRSTLVMPLGTVAMARPSKLEGRVLSILDESRHRGALGHTIRITGLLLTGILVLPLAAMRPDASTPEAGDDVVVEAVAGARWVPAEQENAYRWAGTIAPGQSLEVHGGQGRVQATPTTSRQLEVVAILSEGGSMQHVRVVEHEQGVTVCLPNPEQPDECVSETGLTQNVPTAVNFLVRVPGGVRFKGVTVQGDIQVVGLRSDVEATTVGGNIFVQAAGFVQARTVDGDVDLRTAAFGQASTVRGDIRARLGQTVWNGTLPFSTEQGNIAVELPADANTDIDLHVEADGRLRSAIGLRHNGGEQGERFRGRLGRGGRLLALHTTEGNITIAHRGNQVGRAEDAVAVQVRGSDRRRPAYLADAGSTRSGRSDQHDVEHTRTVRDLASADAGTATDTWSADHDYKALLAQVVADTRYARQFERLGYEELDVEDLVQARLAGLDASYVRDVQRAGYCASLADMARLKAAGVDGTFVRAIKAQGYTDLSVDELLSMRKEYLSRAGEYEHHEDTEPIRRSAGRSSPTERVDVSDPLER